MKFGLPSEHSAVGDCKVLYGQREAELVLDSLCKGRSRVRVSRLRAAWLTTRGARFLASTTTSTRFDIAAHHERGASNGFEEQVIFLSGGRSCVLWVRAMGPARIVPEKTRLDV